MKARVVKKKFTIRKKYKSFLKAFDVEHGN